MLTLKNLSLTAADAQGRADIVKNVSLDVEDGKFLVITGPNGGGKTTLAKLIMGPRRADRRPDPSGRRGHHRPFHHRSRKARYFVFLPTAAPVQGHESLRPSYNCGGQAALA